MLPKGSSTKAPQDHVVIRVVPGVPDKDILEQTMVFSEDIASMVLHLLTLKNNAQCLSVPRTWNVVQ